MLDEKVLIFEVQRHLSISTMKLFERLDIDCLLNKKTSYQELSPSRNAECVTI